MSMFNVIKHATELVNNPDNMNSENDGALAIQKSTSALDTEQTNGSLLIHEFEGDPTQSDKSTTDKTCNIISSEQKSFNNPSDTFSILDLDRKGTADPVGLGQVQNSAAPSCLAPLINDQDISSLDQSSSDQDEDKIKSDGIGEATENGHCAAVESEIRAQSDVNTLENLPVNSEPVKLKEILCKETSSSQTSTETQALADSIPAAVHECSLVIAAERTSDSTPEQGKPDKSKEKLRKTSHKYKSDLTPTMLVLHYYHKDKKPEEYADVHKALQAWSSDEESKTDKTPRTEDNPVSCVLCEFKTLKHSELNQHILIVHVAEQKPLKTLKCPDCPSVYRNTMTLNIHRKKTHPPLLTCPDCRYTSNCKFHLIFHQVVYHPDSRAGRQFYKQTWNRGPYRELYFRLRESPSLVSKVSQPLPKDPFHDECYDFWADLVPSLKIKDVAVKDVVALTDGLVTTIISNTIQGLQIKRQNDEFKAKQSTLQMIELERKSSYQSEKVFNMLDCPKKDPLPKLIQKPHELPTSKKPDIMLMFQDMIRKRYCLLCDNTFNERKKRIRYTIMLDHLFGHFSLRTHYCTRCEITDCNFSSDQLLCQHKGNISELERRKKVMIKAATQERFRTLMSDTKAKLIKRSTDHNAGSTPNIIIAPKPSPSAIRINNTHQQSVLKQQAEVVSVGKENSQQNSPLTLVHIIPVSLIQLQPVTVLQCPLISENTIYKNNCNLIQVDPDRRDDSLSFEEQRFNHDINMLPTANSSDSEYSAIGTYNQCRNESIDRTYGGELNTEKENLKCLTIPETSSNYSMMVEEPDSGESARQETVENVRAPVSDQAKKWFGSVNITDNGDQYFHPTVIFDDYFSFEELRFALFVYAMHTHPKKPSTGKRKRLKNRIRSTTRYSRKTSSNSDESDEEDDPYYRIDNDDLPYEPRVELPIERRSYPKRKQKKTKPFTLLDHEPPETDDNRPIERESDETEKSEEEQESMLESMLTHDSDEFGQIPEEDDNFINGIYLEAGYGIDLSFPADDDIFDFAEDSAEGTTRKKQSDVKKEFKDNELSFWFNDVGGLKEENDCKDLKDCHMKSALGKENEDTNSSVTSDRNVEDETTDKSKTRKPTARKSTASARADKTIVLDKRTKRKLQNITDEVECIVGKDQIVPIDSSHPSEQFLPDDISSLNLPDNIPKLLQTQIRKQLIEKSKLVSNQSPSDGTMDLESVQPIILPVKAEKVDNSENETHPKKRKRSRKLRYSVQKKKTSSEQKSVNSPGPPIVMPQKSPGPPTVRPFKSPEPTFLETPKSPGLPKSPGPPTVRPVDPAELKSLTSSHPRQVCQRSQPGSAEIPQVVIYQKVQDTLPPASPSIPRVTALTPVLKIRMCDPSAAARQIMCRQTKYFFTRDELTNELTRQGNDTLEPRSSHIQNSQPLPQSSNVTTNRRTPDQNISVQIIPCPVTLSNFKSCEYCNKRFKNLFCAKIHYWIDHQQLSYNPDLPLPLTRTSQQEIESRVCPYCRFKLVGDSEELFETHILIHLQLLPYLCGVCFFPAVSPNALEKHTCFTERVLPLKREKEVPGIPVVEPMFEVKIEEKPTVTLCHEMSWKGKRG